MKPIFKSKTEIIIGEVRTSYCHVFAPHGFNGSAEKYSCVLLIAKNDTETLKAVDSAIKAAYEDGVKTRWGGKRPQMANPVLRDGDGMDRNGEPFPAEYAGHWFITAKSSRRPLVVDRHNTPIDSEDAFYSGCYAIARVNFYAFDNNGNKGVAVFLNGLMKTREGERLGGGDLDAAEMFKGVELPVEDPFMPSAGGDDMPW